MERGVALAPYLLVVPAACIGMVIRFTTRGPEIALARAPGDAMLVLLWANPNLRDP